jgi:6-pyruvoyltetrahydropterin/6-carboxytetrahydropterin synthase
MIRLTREVRFSVDRDWAGRIEPGSRVTNSWAGWPSAVGIVPFLCLRATLAGEPDPRSGYVCNIARIDELLRQVAIPWIARRLSEEGWKLSAERLVTSIWPPLAQAAPAGTTLAALELACTPYLSFAVESRRPSVVSLTQQFEFSASHRLHCPQWTDEENRRTFGKCNHAGGHGHNYVVAVTLSGELDAGGAVVPLPRFEQIVQERVIDVLDHKHLNIDVPHFARVNPSVENIARAIWDWLDPHIPDGKLAAVRVYETQKTWAEYRGHRDAAQ